MPRLSRADSFASGDLFVGLSGDNQDYRGYSASVISTWVNSIVTDYRQVTQKNTPADGATVAVTQDSNNRWLLLKPPAAVATLTVQLPASDVATDRQEVTITTTAQIAALTVTASGSTAIYGVPAAMGAENSFTLRYDADDLSWYRV